MIKPKYPLLSTNNVKTVKGESKGYLTNILYMSPFTANSKGINVCPNASAGCAASCLVSSGMGGIYDTVKQGRLRKTEYFLGNRPAFLIQLKWEIERAIVKAEKLDAIPVFRLNGTSDLSYENFKVFDGKNIFEVFPQVQFYDYTKNYNRFNKVLPANYHLTFSRSETNNAIAMGLLKQGVNVAMVFDKLPKSYEGYEVINADLDDLRFLDKKGVICGLKYKFVTGTGGGEKNKAAMQNGFVIITDIEATAKKLAKAYGKVKKKRIFKKSLVISE